MALLALAALPGLIAAWTAEFLPPTAVEPWLPLVAGFLGYGLLWGILFKKRQTGSFLPTFVHELSHAFAALCTFHGVGNLRAGWSSGGRITIRGGSNWLIVIAPYFLPIVPVIGACCVVFAPDEWKATSSIGFGAAIAFYMFSLASDVHAEQTDLQHVGFPFACCFLPSANLFILGGLMAWTVGGPEDAHAFVAEAVRTTQLGAEWIMDHLPPG